MSASAKTTRRGSRLGLAAFLLASFGALSAQAQVTLQVGAAAAYKDIQTAVNACPAQGCILELVDKTYNLPREVWIEKKNNLTIQRSASLKAQGIRPSLSYSGSTELWDLPGTAANPTDPERPAKWRTWPNVCTTVPGGSQNLSNQYSTSGFQNNGLLMIYKSNNIRIEGLQLDGKSAKYFTNKSIWSCKWDVLFGNVGINLFASKAVVLRDNEIMNFFSGIYMQNRNVGGAFAAPNPDDLDSKTIIPYSQFGKVGDHLIESNIIRKNWWAFYDEMEWDIGSTIRYNLVDSNYNKAFATSTSKTSEANNMAGGFMYVKDVMIVPHKIYNNTINGSVLVIGHGGFKPGIQHYFYNNLLTNWYRADADLLPMLKDWRQLMSLYKDFLYNNTFEIGNTTPSAFQVQTFTQGQVKDATLKDPNNPAQTCAAGCWLTWDKPVTVTTGLQFGNALWNGWDVAKGGTYEGVFKGKTYTISDNQVVDKFSVNSAGLIEKVAGLPMSGGPHDISAQENYWANKINMKSLKPGTPGYLEPSWGDPIVDSTILDKGWEAAGNKDQDGSFPDRGAIPKSKGALLSPLSLKDQTIVSLNVTGNTVSFPYCLDGSSAFTNLSIEKSIYYNDVGRRTIDPATGNDKDPWILFPTPVNLTATSAAPKVNSCNTFTATLPKAPLDSFARFEIILKGDLNGKTVKSNVGVWIWRKTEYILDVYFTTPGTTTKVSSVRVGEPVDMHVRGIRTSTGATIPKLDVLAATPDRNTFLVAGDKQINPGDTLGKNLDGAGTVFPVYFTQTGTATIAMSGLVGTLPVPGSGSITVRPGVPEKVIWQNPATYTLSKTATEMAQTAKAVYVQVQDKFGNNIDEVAKVTLGFKNNNPFMLAGFSTVPTGPWPTALGTVHGDVFQTDLEGKLTPYHYVQGREGDQYFLTAQVEGKPNIDSAFVKVGKLVEQLFFTSKAAIDETVSIRVPVTIILSEDGTVVKSASPFANEKIQISSALGTKFYATATSTAELDSAQLVDGTVTVYVTSPTAIDSDTLSALSGILGEGLPVKRYPVSFKLPPVPSFSSARFLVPCDSATPDSIRVSSIGPVGTVGLDSLVVQIGTVRKTLGPAVVHTVGAVNPTYTFATTGFTGLSTGSIGTVQLFYSAAGTVYKQPEAAPGAIEDKLGPIVTKASVVENFVPGSDDTLVVTVSEPLTGLAVGGPLPFAIAGKDLSGAIITSAPAPAGNTYRIGYKGAFGVVADKDVLKLSSTTVKDLAGNLPSMESCVSGRVVDVIASPVPVQTATIIDGTGDGQADSVILVFKRPLLPTETFTNISFVFGTASGTLSGPFGTGVAELRLAIEGGQLAYGITSPEGGASTLTLKASNRNEDYALIDGLGPVVKSAIVRGNGKLEVTLSESSKALTAGTWLDRKAGPADPGTGTPSPDGKVWTFPNSDNSFRTGDSLRLPLTNARLVDNSGIASKSKVWIPIVGAERVAKAIYFDRNGDGIVDQASVEFERVPQRLDVLKFKVGNTEFGVDNPVLVGKVALVDLSAAGFPLETRFDVGNQLGSAVTVIGSETLTTVFDLIDSVAPVLLSANIRWASWAEGTADTLDTLELQLSEPSTASGNQYVVSGGTEAAIKAIQPKRLNFEHQPPILFFDTTDVTDPTLLGRPNPGDKIRLTQGVASDAGGARVGEKSRWVTVTAGKRPLSYSSKLSPSLIKIPMTVAKVDVAEAGLFLEASGNGKVWTSIDGKSLPPGVNTGNGNREGIQLRLSLNGPFEGMVMIYDKIGAFVTQKAVVIDSATLLDSRFTNGTGKFEVRLTWLGRDDLGSKVASGPYLLRFISFRKDTEAKGAPQRKLLQNTTWMVGIKNLTN